MWAEAFLWEIKAIGVWGETTDYVLYKKNLPLVIVTILLLVHLGNNSLDTQVLWPINLDNPKCHTEVTQGSSVAWKTKMFIGLALIWEYSPDLDTP